MKNVHNLKLNYDGNVKYHWYCENCPNKFSPVLADVINKGASDEKIQKLEKIDKPDQVNYC